MSQYDPNETVSFLQSSLSAEPNFREFELYEAAVGGLTFPAINGPLSQLEIEQFFVRN